MRMIEGIFRAVPSSVPRARMLVRSAYGDFPAELLQRVELVVTELVSNAVTHGGTDFDVRVTTGACVRVEVTDGSALPPVLRRSTPVDLSGRGLMIVETFADHWGYETTAGGKVVWAELDDDQSTQTT